MLEITLSPKFKMASKIWEIPTFFRGTTLTFLVPTGFKIWPWWKNNFWEKSPVDEYVFTQKLKISHRSRDKCIFAFYAEIQDGRQKWQEKRFFVKCPQYTLQIRKFCHFWGKEFFLKIGMSGLLKHLGVKNFDQIPLSCMVKEIEANLCFCIVGKNSKWPPFLGKGIFF